MPMTLFSIPVMYRENAVEGKVFVCLRLVVLFHVFFWFVSWNKMSTNLLQEFIQTEHHFVVDFPGPWNHILSIHRVYDFDILSRLNIIEHQFTRIMWKTWKSELASLILFYNSIGLLQAFTGAFAVWGYSSSGLRMHWLPRACLWLRTQRPLGFETWEFPGDVFCGKTHLPGNDIFQMTPFYWGVYEFCEPSRGNVRKERCDAKVSDMSCMLKDTLI